MLVNSNSLLLLQRISVFLDTFNQKPHTELYYSEKLLTLKQKENYEKAIEEISELFSVFENEKGR